MYEGGVREPLIVKWPKAIKPNTISHVPVTSPDFYPTFLEAAGLDSLPEQHTDGVSIMPILKGEEDKLEREAIYWHYPHYGNQGGTHGSSNCIIIYTPLYIFIFSRPFKQQIV